MNTHQSAVSSHPSRSFDRADYRLNYLDLNQCHFERKSTKKVPALATVRPTDEFPVLDDIFCLVVLGAAAEESLKHMGGSLDTSNVPFQGWIERYARKAGIVGWVPPVGLIALSLFRARVLGRVCALIIHESFKKQ